MDALDRSLLEPLTRRPLLLPPNRVHRLWRGGAVLDRFQGRPAPADGDTPEEWIASTTVSRLPGRPADEGLSQVELSGGRRVPLAALMRAFPEAMLGAAHAARFGAQPGMLCKLLDSAMRLFIQAHPDQAFARRHLGSPFGKSEAWIILATRPAVDELPYILLGFRDGVTEADFRRAVRDQDTRALVQSLNRVPVHPGEVYLLDAGTPHALGPGVFLVEIQEPTDLVVNVEYRLFGRTEEQAFMGLGFDLAMRCFDYGAVGQAFVERHRLAPRVLDAVPEAEEAVLIGPEDSPHFSAARLAVHGQVEDRDAGRPYVGIVTAGDGAILGDKGSAAIRAGTTFFVPAASQHRCYRGEVTLIKCFPPGPEGPGDGERARRPPAGPRPRGS
jgi:mannose-6-phosphate isomerase